MAFIEIFIEYGVLGIIAIVFFKLINKTFEQNINNFQKLFDSMLKQNDENIIALKKLGEQVENSARYYETSLTVISNEVDKFKQEIELNNTKIVESILNSKELSEITFKKIIDLLLYNTNYIIYIDIVKELDETYFSENSHVEGFLEFYKTVFELSKSKLQKEISQLNYDERQKDKIIKVIEREFKNPDKILENLKKEELLRDGNFRNIKQRIRNNLNLIIDNVEDVIL